MMRLRSLGRSVGSTGKRSGTRSSGSCSCGSFATIPSFLALGGHAPNAIIEMLGALWKLHEHENRLDIRGLTHASYFFASRDWREAERLLIVAREAGGGHGASIRLGKLHANLATRAMGEDPEEVGAHVKATLTFLREVAEGRGSAAKGRA